MGFLAGFGFVVLVIILAALLPRVSLVVAVAILINQPGMEMLIDNPVLATILFCVGVIAAAADCITIVLWKNDNDLE